MVSMRLMLIRRPLLMITKDKTIAIFYTIPDYAKFIKVSSSTLGSKWLLEADHHTGNVVSIPDITEH